MCKNVNTNSLKRLFFKQHVTCELSEESSDKQSDVIQLGNQVSFPNTLSILYQDVYILADHFSLSGDNL